MLPLKNQRRNRKNGNSLKQYRVIVSAQAKQSLKEIVSFIEQDSPAAARHVRKTLIALIGTLKTSPEKFPKEPILEERGKNYRFMVKWHYKIIYLCTPKDVFVLDIIHTSMNQETIKRVEQNTTRPNPP